MVAGLMVVLIGFAALAIDVSSLYQERRTLQNGADAGALAVAKDCAKTTCVPSKANTFANSNADDGASTVDEVCGTGPGLPGVRRGADGAGRHEVRQGDHQHQRAGRSDAQPDQLQVRSGARPGGPRATRRNTEARRSTPAQWRPGARRAGPPLFRSRSRAASTANTSRPRRRSQTGPPFTGLPESIVSFHGDTASPVAAVVGPPAPTLPGGFGWLTPGRRIARWPSQRAASAGSSTGNSAPTCVDFVPLQNTTVLLPMYDVDAGTGAGGTYHISDSPPFTSLVTSSPARTNGPAASVAQAAETSRVSRAISPPSPRPAPSSVARIMGVNIFKLVG